MSRFFLPVWWGHWLLIGVLRMLVLLPYSGLCGLGNAIGGAMHALLPARRAIALLNIRTCLPHLSDQESAELCRAHFKSLGIAVFEFALTWWASDARLARMTNLRGTEHLQNALRHGRGAILLAAHFTPLELSCRVLSRQFPIDCMYRPADNPFFDALLRRGRERWAHQVIPRDDVRGMLRSLQANDVVWYAPDQGFNGKNAVIARFFGMPAWSNPATNRLVQASGATLLPFSFTRRADCSGYDVVIDAPIENFPSNDAVADTERIHRIFEEQILKAPEQYLWIHRRFKSLPSPNEDFYNEKK